VGLKSDGTVVAAGYNYYGQCNVGNWTDITQVVTGVYHTVGLKSDGTVVAVGWNDYGQCDVGSWTDITQVAAGGFHTVGLKSDGTVVAVGAETELPTWNLLEAAP
jgi:alpha-tubulin suppressor-like RCC1 family protein